VPKKNIIMDSQVLSSLMSCARLTDFRFNHNLRPKGGKSNAIECGALLHTVLEWRNKSLMSGKSANDAISIGFEAGLEYVKGYHPLNNFIKDTEHTGLKNTPEENEKKPDRTGWKHVFKTLEEYYEYYKHIHYPILAAEEVRQALIYEDDDMRVMWKAKFDSILDMPGGFTSCDYKSMKQRRETNSNSNQFIGHCVLLQSRNVMVDKIGFQTSLKPEEKFDRILLSYSADRIAEWMFDIVPYYAQMYLTYTVTGIWPANFTHCENKFGTCEYYRDVCSTDRNMRETALRLYFDEVKPWDVVND
jgi:hypothetical protein